MRKLGMNSFSTPRHFSPPRLVSTATTPDVKLPYRERNGVLSTSTDSTLSAGTLLVNRPVPGSVTLLVLTNSALRCSPWPPIWISPSELRFTPGTRGSASTTVDGLSGRSATSAERNSSEANELGCNPTSCTPAMTSTLSVRRSSGTSVNSRSISCPSV